MTSKPPVAPAPAPPERSVTAARPPVRGSLSGEVGPPRRSGVVLLLPAAVIRAFAEDADQHGDTLADACVRLVRRALGMPPAHAWPDAWEDGPEDPVAVARLRREAHEQGMAEGPGRPGDQRPQGET